MVESISLFTFVERNEDRIVERTAERLRNRTDFDPEAAFDTLLHRMCTGYADMIVVQDASVLDRLFTALVGLLPMHRLRYADVFAVPLTMSQVVQELLLEEYPTDEGPEAHAQLREALDLATATAHEAASRFLDKIQIHLDSVVSRHNAALRRLSETTGEPIEPLSIGRRP